MAAADSTGDLEPITEIVPEATPNGQRRRLARRCLLIAIVLLPGLYLFHLINQYGVDVPYADEFTVAPLLEKAHTNSLTLGDFFKQHNEHRYVFTRLVLIGFARFAQGNLRAEMFFSAILAGLAAINLFVILRRTVPGSLEKILGLLFLMNLLLFSPVQSENWTWGFQFVLLLSNFLFTCGLLIATSSLSIGRKFTICAVLAFVATFSFGGGVILWALTFPFSLLMEKELTGKSRSWWAAAWGCAGIAAMALYFFHYVKPPHHPSIAASKDPLDYFLYLTGFLGAHLSRASQTETLVQAVTIGTGLLAMYVAAVAYAFRHRRDGDVTRRLLPWLALGGYAILNALLAAAARIGFGVTQALDSRYTSFSLYLSIAVIGLLAVARQEIRFRWPNERVERILLRAETALLTAFAAFSLITFSGGRNSMAASERTRLWGKGALLFANVIDTGEIHDRCLIANAPEARMFANQLDSIGLLHPRMLTSAEISKLETRPTQAGFIDTISTKGPACSATGWAIIPKTRRPAHCVVLSYEEAGKGQVAFRVADEIYDRPDVADSLKTDAARASGWACHFDRSAVPPGDHLVSAWAFDANRGILYPLLTPQLLH